jgi:phasin family protein
MQNEIFETLNTITQQMLENWKKLGETNLKIGEKLMKGQIDLTTSLVEAATAHAQEIAGMKDVKEVAALQTEFVQDYGKKVMDASRSYAEMVTEAGKVYNQVFEQGVKAAGDNFAPKAKGKKAA